MGNDQSKGSSRMAISAMSNVMKLTKHELIDLRDRCVSLSSTGKGNDPTVETISRRDFRRAMKESAVAEDNDGEVLDRLFTMWDRSGDDRVDCLPFLVGISPLASWAGVGPKLRFAFELFDVAGVGRIGREDMASVFGSINATASYFGDAVLTSTQVDAIVEDVFNSAADNGEGIKYADHVDMISLHPLVVQFASGSGTMRYGTGK